MRRETGKRKTTGKLVCFFVFAVTMFLIKGCGDAEPPEYSGTEITFSQVDFTFPNAKLKNSDWGRLEVDVIQFTKIHEIKKGFLNIYTEAGWAVQNQLIDTESKMNKITFYFDLGVKRGTNVTTLSAHLRFTKRPVSKFKDDKRMNYTVKSVKFNATGIKPLKKASISRPPKIVDFGVGLLTFDFTKPNQSGENVECAVNQCFPMSIANSLQYLENRYDTIDVPHNHQLGLYGDNTLVGQLDHYASRVTSSRSSGSGVWFVPMMQGKFQYLSNNSLADKLIHKHQDYGYGGTGNQLPTGDFTHAGITSKDESVGGKVTFDWLHQQLKNCEDVEVVVKWGWGGGHAVRVFGCGQTLGVPWIRYKHDREQSDDTTGLEEVQIYVNDMDGDGTLNFGSIDDEIVFALAESPVGTHTSGGDPTGVEVRETFTIHQNVYDDYANDLHFKLWQKEDNINLNGWAIQISHFTDSTSQRGFQPEPAHSTVQNMGGITPTTDPDNGMHAVDVDASGTNIPYCTEVKVDVSFWLESYNVKRISDINWTRKGIGVEKSVPNHGWEIAYPIRDSKNPNQYLHKLTIFNDDTKDHLNITGLTYMVTKKRYNDLTSIEFSSSKEQKQVKDFSVAPGKNWSADIFSSSPLYDGHIYFKYGIKGKNGIAFKDWVDHPVTRPPKAAEVKSKK